MNQRLLLVVLSVGLLETNLNALKAETLKCTTTTLRPDSSSTCPSWSDGYNVYGKPPACPVAGGALDALFELAIARNAAQSYCAAAQLPWYGFSTRRAPLPGNMSVTCCSRSSEQELGVSKEMLRFIDDIMISPSLRIEIPQNASPAQLVAYARTHGYNLTASDSASVSTRLSAQRGIPFSDASCGGLGQSPCSVCVQDVTVYWPFNVCCYPMYTTCTEYGSRCSQGYSQDAFGRCTLAAGVTVDQAISAGCRNSDEATRILNSTLLRTTLGDVTRRKLADYLNAGNRPDGWMTKLDVTDPDTWGYRALTIPGEDKVIVTGKLYSKAQRGVSKTSDVAAFWSAYGPEIAPPANRGEIALSLQMLATASSDSPPSQYLSVALSYDVAAGFGDPVYKFQMQPNSPVLGMKNCQKEGEVQIQVPSGTPIRNLQRYARTKNYWEVYKNGTWVRQ